MACPRAPPPLSRSGDDGRGRGPGSRGGITVLSAGLMRLPALLYSIVNTIIQYCSPARGVCLPLYVSLRDKLGTGFAAACWVACRSVRERKGYLAAAP